MARSEETNTIRVLIADDQPLQRADQALTPESADDIHVVAEAGNGEQTISLARTHRPDVVLMNVRMPGIGGIEVTSIITRDLPGTRAIVLTTFDLDEYAFGSLRSGASAFLLKSTQPEGLVDAVRIVHSGTTVVDPHLIRQLIDHYLQHIDEPATGKQEQALAVLTPREQDVFYAIARGLTNSEISSRPRLAPNTVRSYINTIFAKLGVRDRVHAVLLTHDLEHGPLPWFSPSRRLSPMNEPLPRAREWARTIRGHDDDVVVAHRGSAARVTPYPPRRREEREELERLSLNPAATFASGAGQREREEEPYESRTCLERDRNRIVHFALFRRPVGKTQVVVHPTDHQRIRLTHAIEVAQCAVAVARGIGANPALTDAMALGHDCGHGPGGHASEDAFDAFLPGGYDHGPWSADVVLKSLNLTSRTLDGIRNHSWPRPAPATLEGELVGWVDRIAYCAHDLEDVIVAGTVTAADLSRVVTDAVGTARRVQLVWFIRTVIETTMATDTVGMDPPTAGALGELRRSNYKRIYTRPESVAQSRTVVEVLHGLVEYFLEHPEQLPAEYRTENVVRGAMTYVGGMADRSAFDHAKRLFGWDRALLPRGIGRGA